MFTCTVQTATEQVHTADTGQSPHVESPAQANIHMAVILGFVLSGTGKYMSPAGKVRLSTVGGL